MTAVPKPLKFLRPHYDELTKVYERWPGGADKVRNKDSARESIAYVFRTRSQMFCLCSG